MRKKFVNRYAEFVPPGWPVALNPVALALSRCTYCRGVGIHWKKNPEVCGCVFRHIYRLVVRKYDQTFTRTSVSLRIGRSGMSASRPYEEFRIDCVKLAKQGLHDRELVTAFGLMWDGKDEHVAIPAMIAAGFPCDHGRWWHLTYRAQTAVGRAWVCGQPYGVFPTDEYFTVQRSLPLSCLTGRKINKWVRWSDEEVPLPDRSIPDVRALRIAEEQEAESHWETYKRAA